MAMGRRIRAALVAGVAGWAAAAAACQGPPAAEAALPPFERLAIDSLAGDSAAFATLPAALREFLDVRDAIGEADGQACETLPPRHAHEQRRRLELRLADSTRALVYAAADDSSGQLARVEFVRRIPLRGQRGISWDAEDDRAVSTWWTETRWGLSRRVERGDIPRGGPLPRALRSLGRQLMLAPCTGGVDTAGVSAP
jgi:hypothetical protein